jgi:crotonobetainyl-CoA:carnitine CoA-transferase CaiB-like acyl-CoA transferase
MESNDQRHGVLKGLTVLDLADEKAGYCSKLLADLGALVIKLEQPGSANTRKKPPLKKRAASLKRDLTSFYHNTNKRSITLNIEHEEGRKLFLKLIQKSDVVVESFPPGYLAKLELSYDILREENPGIILASITGFGQSGPHKGYKSCDLVAAAEGGQMYVSGSPSSHPLKHSGLQSYYAASLHAVIGILLAIRKRRKTGEGDHIDISLQDAVVSTLEHVLLGYFYNGLTPGRQGALHWNNLFYLFPCKDGYLRMTLFEQWETLIEWMDSEGMAADLTDDIYLDEDVRLERKEHIIEVMAQWTRTRATKELFELGQLMRFPWAPVQSPEQIIACPQLKARQFFVETDHPNVEMPVFYPRLPFKLSTVEPFDYKPAPLSGEANHLIFSGKLGVTGSELKKFVKRGIM